MRLLGCLLVLPWLTALAQPANALGGAAAVWFHSAFNLALALLAIGFTGPLAALLARLLPEEAQSDDPGMPRYLDEAGLEVANIGLANATREVLRLADMASLMLRATSGLLQRPEAKVAAEIRRQDQALDQLSAAIRAYLADLGQDGLGDSDADRAQEILLFAINIEHIGDLVANSLLPLAMRWAGRSRAGSEFELGRMLPLQAAIEESLHLAISAFLREDLDAALRLVARKKLLQRLEADASRERFRRLRDDRGAWVESGDVFQRILRDYRRIHHHVTALAYPLLERSGIDPMAKRPDEPGQGGIGMRLLICAGRHFKDAERLRLALDQCHGLQPVALLGHLLHAGSGLPDEAERWCRERGADSRAYDYPERSGSDNALREYGEGVLGEAAPDLVLVFPGGRLASELVQVAHAADVPLMLAYRPLSAP